VAESDDWCANRGALHRLPAARIAGMNMMGSGMWSLGFAIVLRAQAEAAEAAGGFADVESGVSAVVFVARLVLLIAEVGALLVSGRWFRRAAAGPLWQLALVCVATALASARWAAGGEPGADHRGRLGADELHHDAMWVFSGVFFSPTGFRRRCSRSYRRCR